MGKKSLRDRMRGYEKGNRYNRKNLKKTETGYINQSGVEFTFEDKKRLESLVNSVNRRRNKQIKEFAELPRMENGKPTGDTVKSLQLMGYESDFIISKRSKSLQRFTTREQFENYLSNLETAKSPKYLDERTRAYKRNYMQALDNVFGDDAKDVKIKVRMMKPEDYRKLVTSSDEDLEISYVYNVADMTAKLNRIRTALGMKLKDDEEIEDF